MKPEPFSNAPAIHAFFYECTIRLTVPAWRLVVPENYFRTPPEHRQRPSSLIATALMHWASQALLALLYAYIAHALTRGTHSILHTAVFTTCYMLPPTFILIPLIEAYLKRKAPHRGVFKAIFALAAAYAYLPAFVAVLSVFLTTWLFSGQTSFHTLLPIILIATCPLRFSPHQPFGLPLITVFAVRADHAAEDGAPALTSRLLRPMPMGTAWIASYVPTLPGVLF